MTIASLVRSTRNTTAIAVMVLLASLVGSTRAAAQVPLPRVRAASARALGATRNPDYAEVLKYASQADADPGVRTAAAQAYEVLWPYGKRVKLAAGLSVLCPGCGFF